MYYLQTLDISEQGCIPRERDRPPPLPLFLGRRISQAYLAALKELSMMVSRIFRRSLVTL